MRLHITSNRLRQRGIFYVCVVLVLCARYSSVSINDLLKGESNHSNSLYWRDNLCPEPSTPRIPETKLLVSICHYQSTQYIVEHLRIFLRYTENSTAGIVHLSQRSEANLTELRQTFCGERVIFHPYRIETARGGASVITAHWINFRVAHGLHIQFSSFMFMAANSFFYRTGVESYVEKYWITNIREAHLVVNPQTNASLIKPCTKKNGFFLKNIISKRLYAKGMCECSFYPRTIVASYLDTLSQTHLDGKNGFEHMASLSKTCFPEEHWHTSWILNNMDWSALSNRTNATLDWPPFWGLSGPNTCAHFDSYKDDPRRETICMKYNLKKDPNDVVQYILDRLSGK